MQSLPLMILLQTKNYPLVKFKLRQFRQPRKVMKPLQLLQNTLLPAKSLHHWCKELKILLLKYHRRTSSLPDVPLKLQIIKVMRKWPKSPRRVEKLHQNKQKKLLPMEKLKKGEQLCKKKLEMVPLNLKYHWRTISLLQAPPKEQMPRRIKKTNPK